MNQILLTNEPNNNNKKDINKYSSNNSNMKNIILFFAIVIIVFGVALSGFYGYKIYNKNKSNNVEISKPELSIEKYDNVAQITIVAKSKVGLDKIIYSWNNEEEVVKELNGVIELEEPIDIPTGENIINLKVIDLNGQEQTATERFIVIAPNIETAIVEDVRLKIMASSENTLKYMTYKWNDEEEVRIDAGIDVDKTLETIIDIKRGENKITITAVDSNNIKGTYTKTIIGKIEPTIDVTRDEAEQRLYLKVTHDIGIKKIEYEVNGNTYTYDENTPGYNSEKKEIEYYFNLKEGENIVIIKATSMEDTEKIYRGKCTYIPE